MLHTEHHVPIVRGHIFQLRHNRLWQNNIGPSQESPDMIRMGFDVGADNSTERNASGSEPISKIPRVVEYFNNKFPVQSRGHVSLDIIPELLKIFDALGKLDDAGHSAEALVQLILRVRHLQIVTFHGLEDGGGQKCKKPMQNADSSILLGCCQLALRDVPAATGPPPTTPVPGPSNEPKWSHSCWSPWGHC